METSGKAKFSNLAKLVSLIIVGLAVAISIYAYRWSYSHPSTSDGAISADIVHVAPTVGGRVIELAVSENKRVTKGDLLFQIDPVPYQHAVAQAKADLAVAEALLQTQMRVLSTQGSKAIIAKDEEKKAQQNYELAKRTADRLRPLAAQGYVPKQQLDQAEVAERDTENALRQAHEAQVAAERAIDTDAAAVATVLARQAALANVERALNDTTIRAPHDGLIVGLHVSSGEMVAPAQSLFTLINTEEWFAEANFRETDLEAITVGDCATVYSMIDRRLPIKGIVDGIGWGVLDTEHVNIPRSLPYVQRSLNWVRVAQRFPVRIRLENPPLRIVRLGASAVAEIKRGAACP